MRSRVLPRAQLEAGGAGGGDGAEDGERGDRGQRGRNPGQPERELRHRDEERGEGETCPRCHTSTTPAAA